MVTKHWGLMAAMVVLVLVVASCFGLQGDEPEADEMYLDREGAEDSPDQGKEAEEEPPAEEITEAEADIEAELLAVEEAFYQMLVEPKFVDGPPNAIGREVKDYQSKEELVKDLTEVIIPEFATYYVDLLYEEKDNKLFMIPKGAPMAISLGFPYELTQIDADTAEIVQEIDQEFFYHKLRVQFKKIDGRWLISDRQEEGDTP